MSKRVPDWVKFLSLAGFAACVFSLGIHADWVLTRPADGLERFTLGVNVLASLVFGRSVVRHLRTPEDTV